MRLLGYLRVSTNGQADNGTSLPGQREAIQTWARENGHEVVGWYQDAGVSGAKELEDRDGLADAFHDLRQGEAQGLVVYRLDRLARDLIVQETLLAELWGMQIGSVLDDRDGAAVFSTIPSEGEYLTPDTDDPSRKLIRQTLGAVAEYERSMIALRMKAGRDRKRRQGGYAGGRPPFGWKAEDGELVPCPDEQETVQLARELREDGMSYRQIAERLVEEGHPPRAVRDAQRKAERGDEDVEVPMDWTWHPPQVSALMDDPEVVTRTGAGE